MRDHLGNTLPAVRVCSDAQCERPATRRGLCPKHYMQHWTRMKMYGRWQSVYVPTDAAREHYTALLDAGMDRNQIARLTGISRSQLNHLLHARADRGNKPAARILRENQDKLLALTVPEPSQLWRYRAGGSPVDGTGTSRRLQGLVAPQSHLAQRLDIQPGNLTGAVHGRCDVSARFARKVAELFEELQLTPGPSSTATARARRLGWHPPLAWEEGTIDDPAAAPGAAEAVDPAGDVDAVAVDRGIAHARLWAATRSTERGALVRPAMTRAEKLAVVERLREEIPIGVLCRAVGTSDRQLPHGVDPQRMVDGEKLPTQKEAA
ncbi:hypothetical protein ACTHRK_16740 [Dietzia cercidiphylli]|uniref:hypothetical protein n=1 Tax=Dietzia cercidiphylli TaxID=498199 RepID=UPI003F7ECA86